MASHFEFEIRLATIDDLDEIVKVDLNAFPQDPQYDYRFPYREQFPQDTKKYTKKTHRELMDCDRYTTMVAITPSDEDESVKKIVAFSVWEVRKFKDDFPGDDGGSDADGECHFGDYDDKRRDANPEHVRTFRNTLNSAQAKLFTEKYGDGYFSLTLLATHQDYQRRGAGTLLCKYGLAIADRRDGYVSTFASPMGHQLYSKLGWHDVQTLTVQVDGEDEKLSIPAMIYHNIKSQTAPLCI